jgi:hypothetical protein
MTSKFVWDSANDLKLFTSTDAMNKAALGETIRVAKAFGFDTTQEENGSTLCGKAGTATLVEVFPDGSWEYRDAAGDEEEIETGPSAAILGVWLSTLPRP